MANQETVTDLINNTHWQLFHSLNDLTPEVKEAVFSYSDNPFTSLNFLLALEQSNCVGEQSGWLPCYFLYQKDEEASARQLGLFICFLKTHSYGEYVFDWAWADAYQRNGLAYYPKLLAGIPFSPIPCNKWLSNTTISELAAFDQIKQLALTTYNISGCHYIFPQSRLNKPEKWIEREGHQFHWFNQNKDKSLLIDFEQYLSLMTARKRKNIIKERKKIQDAGITTQWRSGANVTDSELETFYHCYQSTYYKRRQTGYLNLAFFKQLCATMLEQVQILFCYQNETIIAGALYIRSKDTLYGRYWGSLEDYEIVHFEACYYQGIEYCIANKLSTFNPGTQGEHKISRGFIPTKTYSYHQIELMPFHQAIDDFCQQEKIHNHEYMQACAERLPFKQE